MLRWRAMSGSGVSILFGGTSNERRVSVASAQNVSSTLDEAEAWFLAPSGAVHRVAREELAGFERPFERDFQPAAAAEFPSVVAAFDQHRSRVFFLALHGGEGEDGTIQRMLEARRIAFTGPGAEASARAFDKEVAKEVAYAAGVRIAHSVHLSADQIEPAAQRMEESGESYLAEEFISGTELTVGVVDGPSGPRALPPSEVRLEQGRAFDYEGKYLGKGTREITPAEVPDGVSRAAQKVALDAHRALGCEGYSRTDVICADRGPVFLEINTLPGLTRMSFIPQQLAAEGTPMKSFLDSQLALARHRRDRA